MSFLALGLVTAASPSVARADVSLQVSVVDAVDRTPLANVAVVAENTQTGASLEQTTDPRGKARFGGLTTAGQWRVRTATTGTHAAAVSDPITLRSRFESSITLAVSRLSPGGEDIETITIRGERSITQLNTTNAEVSATLDAGEISRIPTEARSLDRVLFRLPNVSLATGFFPEAPVVAINGANSLFTNYMIDGLDNNENFLGGQRFAVPVGMVQSVTVLASNYSVEFGRTANGVVNVTSRGGTNDLEGSGFFVTRPGILSTGNEFQTTDLTGNPVQDDFTRVQAGFTAGGPIVEDRTFYFANLEYTRDSTENQLVAPELGVNETIAGTNDTLLGTLRLDHYWSDRWWSTLRANHGRVSVERPGGGLTGGNTFPSAASEQDRFSTNVAFTTTYRGDAWDYAGSVQYSRFEWDYGEPLGAPGPQVTVLGPDEETLAVVGHPGFIFDDVENTWQTQHKLVWEAGRHRVKFGGEVIVAGFSLTGGGNVDGNYLVRLRDDEQLGTLADRATVGLQATDVPADAELINANFETQPNAFGTTQALYGVYVEDQIQLTSALSVTLGLRWDYDSLSTAVGAAPGDFDNLAPRGGFNWSVTDSFVVRGGVGLFYEKIPYAVVSDAIQQSTRSPAFLDQLRALQDQGIIASDVDLAEITRNGNFVVDAAELCSGVLQCPDLATIAARRDELTSAERRILNPEGYDNPFAVQSTLGVQWQPSAEWLLTVDGVYSEGFDLVRLRDLNAPAPFDFNEDEFERLGPDGVAELTDEERRARGLVRSVEAANATRPTSVNGRIPRGGARSVIVSETAGRSRYVALNVGLYRSRRRGWWDFNLFYTLSRLENDTDDINFRANDANDFEADRGPSLNDRTHVFSGVLNVYPTERLTVSLAGLVQSGQPVNFVPDAEVFGTTDLNGDGLSFADQFTGNPDRFPGVGRNAGRLDWSATFDLGLQYAFPLLGTAFITRLDVFNLFNATNQSGYAVNFTNSNQRQIFGRRFEQRSASPPVTLQLTAQWQF